jgi:hypothetical protein
MPFQFGFKFKNGRVLEFTIIVLPFWAMSKFETDKGSVYFHEMNFAVGIRPTYATDNTWSLTFYTPLLSLQMGYYDAT